MSINFSQTQECAGKLDLMRVGKMSVHQWIIQGVLIHWCTLSTPTQNVIVLEKRDHFAVKHIFQYRQMKVDTLLGFVHNSECSMYFRIVKSDFDALKNI